MSWNRNVSLALLWKLMDNLITMPSCWHDLYLYPLGKCTSQKILGMPLRKLDLWKPKILPFFAGNEDWRIDDHASKFWVTFLWSEMLKQAHGWLNQTLLSCWYKQGLNTEAEEIWYRTMLSRTSKRIEEKNSEVILRNESIKHSVEKLLKVVPFLFLLRDLWHSFAQGESERSRRVWHNFVVVLIL